MAAENTSAPAITQTVTDPQLVGGLALADISQNITNETFNAFAGSTDAPGSQDTESK